MLWFEILMTELGVGNDKVRGGGVQSSVVRQDLTSQVKQSEAMWRFFSSSWSSDVQTGSVTPDEHTEVHSSGTSKVWNSYVQSMKSRHLSVSIETLPIFVFSILGILLWITKVFLCQVISRPASKHVLILRVEKYQACWFREVGKWNDKEVKQ